MGGMVEVVVVVVVVLAMSSGVMMQSIPPESSSAGGPMASSSPGPSGGAELDCMTALFGMADCLSYVSKGSNDTKPDPACCPELKTLVDNTPICLCQMLANTSASGFDIDINRATKLPTVCKLDTPPLSTCALLGYPVEGPTASEGPSSSLGPTASQGPSFGILPAAGGGSPAPPPSRNDVTKAWGSISIIFMTTLLGLAISFN